MIVFTIIFMFISVYYIVYYLAGREIKLCMPYSIFFDSLRKSLNIKDVEQLENSDSNIYNFETDFQKMKKVNESSELEYHLKSLECITNFEIYLSKNKINSESQINLKEFYKLKKKVQLNVLESTKKCNRLM